MPDTVPCRFCAESVDPDAVKCMHCGEFLDEERLAAQEAGGSSANVIGLVLGVFALAIIVLVAGSVFAYHNARTQAVAIQQGLAKVQADLTLVQKAVHRYRKDVGVLPAKLDDLWTAPPDLGDEWQGPYLVRDPTDPWGNPYLYETKEAGYRLTSHGADGLPGGSGVDMDITVGN